MSEVSGNIENVPPNTLILPDGNRRWAVEHGVSYADAYEQSAKRIVECSRYLGRLGAQQLWFGIARPFNFRRTGSEVLAVLDACLRIQDIGQEDGQPFNVTVNGNLDLMPSSYRKELKAQESTNDPGAITAHLLIGWSSDTEAASFAQRVRKDTGETIEQQLLRGSAVTEPIDYLIRTGVNGQGGRVSGMIPLHSLGAELHFEPTFFPDFTTAHMDAAYVDYASRTHRNQISL